MPHTSGTRDVDSRDNGVDAESYVAVLGYRCRHCDPKPGIGEIQALTSRESGLAVRTDPGNGGHGGASNAVVAAYALGWHYN
jgi:hypothetical protein